MRQTRKGSVPCVSNVQDVIQNSVLTTSTEQSRAKSLSATWFLPVTELNYCLSKQKKSTKFRFENALINTILAVREP